MTKREVLVFPDWCASGLWDAETGQELAYETLNLSVADSLLMEMWCDIWETMIATTLDNEEPRASEWYVENWKQNGAKIVCRLNLLYANNNFTLDLT